MKILVTGASGFIGKTCLRTLAHHEVLGTYRSTPLPDLERVDLLDPARLFEVVDRFNPDAIIHSAAKSSVDWCETNPKEARELNVETSLNVLEAANRVGARVAFISTDYVFDGTSGPYGEDDAVHPLNAYGRLKLEIEGALLTSSRGHLVVRTTNVYGYDPSSKNFLMALLPGLARGEAASVAEDQYGTPIHVEDLTRSIGLLLERGSSGIVHVAGPDFVNRVEWLQEAVRAFGMDEGLVKGHATLQLGQAAQRPLRAGLRISRLESLGIPRPRAVGEGLRHMAAEKQAAREQAW